MIKDKVLIGTAGGEYPTRGFVAAYDVNTGKEAWKFHTIPAPGEPGNDTWPGRRLGARRRLGLAHRLVRSGAQSDLLGHRQSQS